MNDHTFAGQADTRRRIRHCLPGVAASLILFSLCAPARNDGIWTSDDDCLHNLHLRPVRIETLIDREPTSQSVPGKLPRLLPPQSA